MKQSQLTIKNLVLSMTVFGLVMLNSCGNDDETTPEDGLTGNSVVFQLGEAGTSGVSGTATFEELESSATKITISLSGTASGDEHPSHIHMNTAAETGAIVIDLSNVDGATGNSVTDVSQSNDGTTIAYAELAGYDGYINVHNSSADLGTLVAQGDIGQNALMGESQSYDLTGMGSAGLSGTVKFAKRVNEETLVMVTLDEDAADSDHPAHIHMNTAVEGGSIEIDLNNVKAGVSKTNVTQKRDGTVVTYDNLIDFDGYVNIHQSADELGISVSQGDIGQNKLMSGVSETYTVNAVASSGISGSALFEKRVNGQTLVTLTLVGTSQGTDHPAHIHMGSVANPLAIVIDLSDYIGDSPDTKTNIGAFNDGTAVTYDELIQYDGYINVHDAGLSVANGNIGSNG